MYARNPNLECILNYYIDNNRLRWVYLRDSRRQKIGLICTFTDFDSEGQKELYVGLSKVNRPAGDEFALDLGLIKAIKRAVPFEEFCKKYEEGLLPRINVGWRTARDENGEVIKNEYDFYDQYEEFVNKLKNVYPKIVSPTLLEV